MNQTQQSGFGGQQAQQQGSGKKSNKNSSTIKRTGDFLPTLQQALGAAQANPVGEYLLLEADTSAYKLAPITGLATRVKGLQTKGAENIYFFPTLRVAAFNTGLPTLVQDLNKILPPGVLEREQNTVYDKSSINEGGLLYDRFVDERSRYRAQSKGKKTGGQILFPLDVVDDFYEQAFPKKAKGQGTQGKQTKSPRNRGGSDQEKLVNLFNSLRNDPNFVIDVSAKVGGAKISKPKGASNAGAKGQKKAAGNLPIVSNNRANLQEALRLLQTAGTVDLNAANNALAAWDNIMQQAQQAQQQGQQQQPQQQQQAFVAQQPQQLNAQQFGGFQNFGTQAQAPLAFGQQGGFQNFNNQAPLPFAQGGFGQQSGFGQQGGFQNMGAL
ncbi:Tetratricopeptide repeat protein [Orpheovirus IHUMI-LCC2]|uniref:Tetratricopeptide repeat protein n=1 Tax=Orpheovirus IHUMI-LCC2 TaxID=2023057 RepID=A0A2I2L5Y2_9VIRU|nr:Tetratricopeptide repeat protein [Orpheovirus IHUMI-LCC2]SNW62921.1 Tetratricopeptide repeat protein [Orpheovirus IHUMI-LCC2]